MVQNLEDLAPREGDFDRGHSNTNKLLLVHGILRKDTKNKRELNSTDIPKNRPKVNSRAQTNQKITTIVLACLLPISIATSRSPFQKKGQKTFNPDTDRENLKSEDSKTKKYKRILGIELSNLGASMTNFSLQPDHPVFNYSNIGQKQQYLLGKLIQLRMGDLFNSSSFNRTSQLLVYAKTGHPAINSAIAKLDALFDLLDGSQTNYGVSDPRLLPKMPISFFSNQFASGLPNRLNLNRVVSPLNETTDLMFSAYRKDTCADFDKMSIPASQRWSTIKYFDTLRNTISSSLRRSGIPYSEDVFSHNKTPNEFRVNRAANAAYNLWNYYYNHKNPGFKDDTQAFKNILRAVSGYYYTVLSSTERRRVVLSLFGQEIKKILIEKTRLLKPGEKPFEIKYALFSDDGMLLLAFLLEHDLYLTGKEPTDTCFAMYQNLKIIDADYQKHCRSIPQYASNILIQLLEIRPNDYLIKFKINGNTTQFCNSYSDQVEGDGMCYVDEFIEKIEEVTQISEFESLCNYYYGTVIQKVDDTPLLIFGVLLLFFVITFVYSCCVFRKMAQTAASKNYGVDTSKD